MEGATEIFPPGYPFENDNDEFEMTHTELNQIKEAMKDVNFRNLLSEYIEDVQSPESQKTYQDEVRQLEKERGNTVHFLNPIPGYVIKTSVNGDKKAFINICSNPVIRKLSCQAHLQNEKKGFMWSIPYAQSPPREDMDKAGKICMVYDVIFSPETVLLAQKNHKLKEKIESTALEAVEKSFNVSLDKNNMKKPKTKFKGMTKATVIKYKTGENPPDILELNAINKELPPQPKDIYSTKRKNTTSVSEGGDTKSNSSKTSQNKVSSPKEGDEGKTKKSLPEKISQYTQPNYKLKYRSHVDMQDYCFDNQREGRSSSAIPQEIQLIIDLPMLKNSSTIDADVIDDGRSFELKSDGKIKYQLTLKLPFQVRCDSVKATFDKDKRKLIVNMKTVEKRQVCPQIVSNLESAGIQTEQSQLIQCLDEDDIEEVQEHEQE